MSNYKFCLNTISKLLGALLMLGTAVSLSGCGDDAFTPPADDTTNDITPGGGTPSPSPSPSSSPGNGPPAHTITLTYSQSASVEHLGGGVYRRGGRAIVLDANGHTVADGTVVQLSIIDSVIAQGLIDANDAIQGNTIDDLDVMDGGGNPSLFTGANVIRNSAVRYIQPGDHIFLTYADGEDKSRVISAGGILDNQLTVNQAYLRNYPDDADYPAASTGYLVGASLLGASISGEDMSGNLVSGYSVTNEGIATFYVTYPATVDAILSGCFTDPTVDTRAVPAGSAQVYLVASVNSAVTTVDERFCFTSIAGGRLYAVPEDLTTSGIVTVSYEDGGDTVQLPFVPVNVTVSDANGSDITINGATDKSVTLNTDESGYVDFTVQVNAPPATGNATITIASSFDPDVDPVTVTVSSNTVVTPPVVVP